MKNRKISTIAGISMAMMLALSGCRGSDSGATVATTNGSYAPGGSTGYADEACVASVDSYYYPYYDMYDDSEEFNTEEYDAVKESGAEAVIFYTNIYEEAASWDYPSQKKSLDEQGIKNGSWVKMQYPAGLNEGLAQSIAQFVKGLEA